MIPAAWAARLAGVAAAGLLLSVGAVTLPVAGATAVCPVVAPDGTVTPGPSAGVDWTGCDLSGAHLHAADLRSAFLSSAILKGADLSAANLTAAKLQRTNLDGADLTGATATAATLEYTRMLGANVTGTAFGLGTALLHVQSRDLVGVPVSLPSPWHLVNGALLGPTAIVDSVDLSGADLHALNLNQALLTNVSLAGADLRSAVLTGVRLVGADVTDARLDGASMAGIGGTSLVGQPAAAASGARVWSTDSGYLIGPRTVLAGATLLGSDLSDRDLTGIDLTRAQLLGVDLRRATLAGATLSAAKFSRVQVDGLNLAAASATFGFSTAGLVGMVGTLPSAAWRQVGGYLFGPGASLRAPDLSGMDLRDVPFTGLQLEAPAMRGSNLAGKDMSGLQIDSWDLSGANMAGANLSGSTIVRSLLIGATLHGADMTGTTVGGSDATRADLTSADLTSSTWGYVAWTGADLRGAVTTGMSSLAPMTDAICSDGYVGRTHYGDSCAKPRDVTRPVVSLDALPTFVWTKDGTVRLAGRASDDATVIYHWWEARETPAVGGPTDIWTPPIDPSTEARPTLKYYGQSGSSYCFALQSFDEHGNGSAWAVRCTTLPIETGFLDRSRGWSWGSSSAFMNGDYSVTSQRGAWMSTISAKVRQVGVVAATCPSCGSVAIYVGSQKVGSISLKRATTTARTLVTLPRFTSIKSGKVRLVVTSGKVRIDALAVTRF